MSLQKVEHTTIVHLGEHLSESKISRPEIGPMMDEFCKGTASRCSRVGGCVIGVATSVEERGDEDLIHVELGCRAWLKTESLDGCSVADRAPTSVDTDLAEFILSANTDTEV